MKLITLNIWGGHIRNPLLEFIALHQQTDIFCFQEVYDKAPHKISDDNLPLSLNILSELQRQLPDHHVFFRPVVNNFYGIGMFIKKTIPVLSEGEITIFENPHYKGSGPTHTRKLQWVKCPTFCIMNVHGLWNGNGKSDSPDRINQSQKIQSFLDTHPGPKILCGDFNLRPDTTSIKILEKGMKNLIDAFKVTSTRTRFYPKEEKFADYIFTSPEITIHHFEVLNDEVSDHAPLLLDFSITRNL